MVKPTLTTLAQLRRELEKIQATLDFAQGRAPKLTSKTYLKTYAQLYAEAEAQSAQPEPF